MGALAASEAFMFDLNLATTEFRQLATSPQ